MLENLKDFSEAVRVTERIQTELKLPFNLDRQEIFATARIGIAISSTDDCQPEALLRDADIVMCRAKALGKARLRVV